MTRKHTFSENKQCSLYLGIHVAEKVLSHVFKNVEVMPHGNKGYDFICNHGKKIDVKSACIGKNGAWLFNIKHNTIADYFLCIAFDNRNDLNPTHAWLIPGSKFSRLVGVSISISTIHKWDDYWLDIDKIVMCCDICREKSIDITRTESSGDIGHRLSIERIHRKDALIEHIKIHGSNMSIKKLIAAFCLKVGISKITVYIYLDELLAEKLIIRTGDTLQVTQ